MTSYLVVRSANAATGPRSRVVLDVPEDSLRCSDNEFLQLTCVYHAMRNTINNFPSGTSVSVAGVPIPIPPGAYKICDYVTEFNRLSTAVKLGYLENENRLLYRCESLTTISVPRELAPLFGLSGTQTLPAGTTKSGAINAQPLPELFISVESVMPGPPYNLSNMDGELRQSAIIGVIPMRAPPHAVNVFHNNNGSFVMNIHDTNIQQIGFVTTDAAGKEVPDLPDYTMVIRCDIVPRPTQDAVSKRLDELLKLARLHTLALATGVSAAGTASDDYIAEPVYMPPRS
jgi:hypothetical protein